ncbi:MAG: large repetitive protein [Actinomycetota bacterium]|nr:large repetitive protein [Actinomycetota bacterium]
MSTRSGRPSERGPRPATDRVSAGRIALGSDTGNHEYETGSPAAYFSYWHHPAHFYSVDAGGWHLISLDSTTDYLQDQPGTEQYDWLANDLATSTSDCTLVFFHHPTFSNVTYGASHGGLGRRG